MDISPGAPVLSCRLHRVGGVWTLSAPSFTPPSPPDPALCSHKPSPLRAQCGGWRYGHGEGVLSQIPPAPGPLQASPAFGSPRVSELQQAFHQHPDMVLAKCFPRDTVMKPKSKPQNQGLYITQALQESI